MILDPRPMDVIEWTSQMTLQLDRFGSSMRLDNPAEWQAWANNTLLLVGLSDAQLNPYIYSNWLSWAIRFSDVAEPYLDAS